MDTILLSPDLQIAVSKLAEQEAKSVDEVLHEAVRGYQRQRNHEKLRKEIAAYEALHAELKQKYFGEFVAVHDGQLVDRDHDRAELYRRVRQTYGNVSVLIREVTEEPIQTLWWRTPSAGKSARQTSPTRSAF